MHRGPLRSSRRLSKRGAVRGRIISRRAALAGGSGIFTAVLQQRRAGVSVRRGGHGAGDWDDGLSAAVGNSSPLGAGNRAGKPAKGSAERGASTRPTGERLRRGGGGRAERRAGGLADHNVCRSVFRTGTPFDNGSGAHSAGWGLYGADRDAGAVGRNRSAGKPADRAAMEAGARVIFSGLRRTLRLDADAGCAGPGGIIWMRNAVGKAGAGVAGCADYVFPCSAAAGDGHGERRNAARCVRGGAAGLRWDLPRLAKNEGGNSDGDTL